MKKPSGILMVAAAAFLWSTGGVMIKIIPLNPIVIAGVRAFIAFLVFLPFLKLSKIKFSWKLLLLLVSYPIMSSTFVISTKLTTAGNAIAIQYTATLWIFIAQVIFRKTQLNLRRSAPMLFAAIGIFIFLMEPNVGSSFAGNMVALVSGVAYALTLVSFRILREEHKASLVCLANLSAAAILLPLAGSDLRVLADLAPTAWIGLVYMGAVQIGASYFLYSKGVETVSALKSSTVALIEPVLNPIMVFIVTGEIPTVYGICGAAAILSGVLLDAAINRKEIQKPSV